MAVKLKQDVRLTQQLVLTPQLQQAIKILQLSKLDLLDKIKEEVETNPVLEYDDETGFSHSEELPKIEKELSVDDRKALEEMDWFSYAENLSQEPNYSYAEDEEDDYIWEKYVKKETTLRDYLLEQLYTSDLSEDEMIIGEKIIGNIDDDGFLRVSLEEILSPDELDKGKKVLKVIQGFDPPGIGARDLKEAFLIQAKEKNLPDFVREAVEKYFHLLIKGDLRGIVEKMGLNGKEDEFIKEISKLDPKPGRNFGGRSDIYITPDVIVKEIDGKLEVFLYDDDLPPLRVNRYYINLMNSGKLDKTAKDYIKDKLKSALWFIKMIDQRKKTILSVAKSIVKFQERFFYEGIKGLRPLTLKDVANDIGVHESTVSRVVSNKYMETPQGLYLMKFFFSGGVGKEEGDQVSSKVIREMIREIIENEDKNKPLSDSEIRKILRERGINIARRTVAKYRDLMGIPSSHERKRIIKPVYQGGS